MRRFVEVNEAAIFAQGGEVAEWWVLWEVRQPERRMTVMTASIGGNRVRVECDGDEHAEEFAQMLIEKIGVPKSAVKVIPAPRLGFEHACMSRGTVTCVLHGAGKPKTKKCPRCGGQWAVTRGTHALVTWRGDGRYDVAAAHATYASHAPAWAAAEKRVEKDWVVRFIGDHSL